MRMLIEFAEGCTGDDDEMVTITLPVYLWRNLRSWLADVPSSPGTARWSLTNLVRMGGWQDAGDGTASLQMHRAAAQWVMAYFEGVANVRIVLRPEGDDASPIWTHVVQNRMLI